MSLQHENQESRFIAESVVDSLLLFARQWDESTAEDVVQNALVKLFELAEPPENTTAWLFALVRNESNDRFRRRKKTERLNEDYALSREHWFEPDHESRLDAAVVAGQLQELPLDLREIIVAKIWGELTYEEIAEVTGSSKSTVHRKYVEGLSQLKKMVQK
ncbi:MAG: sigma-70 family RNA polymerase sigma factor [Planctomycetaceae bacterium]|nr:sigma-70 family RNA polymerase sigma factor [Planctomycetaceae bacterium]